MLIETDSLFVRDLFLYLPKIEIEWQLNDRVSALYFIIPTF